LTSQRHTILIILMNIPSKASALPTPTSALRAPRTFRASR